MGRNLWEGGIALSEVGVGKHGEAHRRTAPKQETGAELREGRRMALEARTTVEMTERRSAPAHRQRSGDPWHLGNAHGLFCQGCGRSVRREGPFEAQGKQAPPLQVRLCVAGAPPPGVFA